MAQDFYDILGVKRSASDKEIRSAYRARARKFHPDVNPGNAEAEDRFKQINRAYEVLSDPDSRQKYDKYGENWQHADQIEEMRRQQAARGAMPGGGFGPGGGGVEFDIGDLGDLFGGRASGGSSGGGFFDSLFGRAGGRRRGADLEHEVTISLDDAYRGTTRTLEVRDGEERCMVCGGEGTLAGATCHACRGSGVAAPVRRIEVNIPAGVDDGTRIRLAGRGAPGANGAAAGDLLLRVHVTSHPQFERDGANLRTDVDVAAWDAALGGEARVPTLKGKSLALRIPAGTAAGKVFRLAGQGMPRRGGGFGDLYARVRIVIPESLTDEQRRLFEQLRASAAGEKAGAR